MNSIKLVVDTATDLPKEILSQYNISQVHLNVIFGDQDVTGISNRDFYEKMKTFPVLPKTSAPSPERFIEQYDAEEDVLMLTLTQKLSSTFSAASLAKDIYYSQRPNNKVEVIDTTNGCIGSGLLAIKVAEMIEKGVLFDEAVKKIHELKNHIIHVGLLETLDNAVKGGRVSRVRGIVANALNIKPIVEIKDGLVKPIDKARGTKNGLSKLIEIVLRSKQNSNHQYTILGIAHANAYERAIAFKEEVLKSMSFDQVVVAEIGPLMGTYTAEGAIMFAIL